MTAQATTSGTATVQVPRTEPEVRALMLQREELSSQLRSLGESQQRLIIQRQISLGDGNAAAAQQLNVRIKELGDRFARIENEKLAADDAISQALARGITTSDVPPTTTPDFPDAPFPGFPGMDMLVSGAVREARRDMRNDFQRMMVAEGVVLVLVGVVISRWWFRRAIARVKRELTSAPPSAHRELRDAVDAIALEVERISENQRFVTKLLSDRPAEEVLQRPDAKAR